MDPEDGPDTCGPDTSWTPDPNFIPPVDEDSTVDPEDY